MIFENRLLTTLTSGSDTSLAGVVSAARFRIWSSCLEESSGWARSGSIRTDCLRYRAAARSPQSLDTSTTHIGFCCALSV